MQTHSRRHFLRGTALASLAACCLSPAQTLAMGRKKAAVKSAKAGSVILFQGDSITDGNRGRNTDPNHIMGHGYAFSIASRVGADHPEKKYQFYNRGISGNKVNDLEKRWQTDTLDLKPDILSILVGVNDASSVIFHRDPVISPEQYEKTYRSLLEQTRAQLPEVLFVLCLPFVLRGGKVTDNWEAYQADIHQRQSIVRQLAASYDAVLVDFQEVFDKACQKAPFDYWIWDGVHPTVPGHELMAREWLRQVEKRIEF